MNTLEGSRLFSIEVPERRAVPIDLELVSLCAAFGLLMTGLFLALGFGLNLGQALMLAG
jgi:hypothetical protein